MGVRSEALSQGLVGVRRSAGLRGGRSAPPLPSSSTTKDMPCLSVHGPRPPTRHPVGGPEVPEPTGSADGPCSRGGWARRRPRHWGGAVVAGSAPAQEVLTVAEHEDHGRMQYYKLATSSVGWLPRVNVLLPDGYDATRRHPVLYLLHGGGEDYSTFDTKYDIRNHTAGRDLIVVMPDGGAAGWYCDPESSNVGPRNWETFHIKELIPWVDATFATDLKGGTIYGIPWDQARVSADNPVEHVESYRGKRVFLVSGRHRKRSLRERRPAQPAELREGARRYRHWLRALRGHRRPHRALGLHPAGHRLPAQPLRQGRVRAEPRRGCRPGDHRTFVRAIIDEPGRASRPADIL